MDKKKSTIPPYDNETVLSMADEISISYDLGDLGQMDFDYDEELRKKYPGLKDAWEHYINVKQMCESKEKESDEN